MRILQYNMAQENQNTKSYNMVAELKTFNAVSNVRNRKSNYIEFIILNHNLHKRLCDEIRMNGWKINEVDYRPYGLLVSIRKGDK